MIRILVVDDHAIIRRGILDILNESTLSMIITEAIDGIEALKVIREQAFDLVILDIALPDMNGLNVLSQVKAMEKDIKILMLSIHPEQDYAVRALKMGADGYLSKDSTPNELLRAIDKIMQGGRYISENFAERLSYLVTQDHAEPVHELLSAREFEVFLKIAQGKGGTEIGEELSISPKTVSTYKTRIQQKMKLETMADFARYALKKGLIN